MNNAQSLAQVNIFDVLGLKDGAPEEREEFLGQLQDAIWEEVVAKHEEKLGEAEILHFEEVLSDESLSADEKRSQLYGTLVGLIPNLDAVLAEETEGLKVGLLHERVEGMMSYFQGKPETAKVQRADELFHEGKYQEVVTILNGVMA